MAYVIWKIFMKQYSRFRFDLATATAPSSAALLIAPYNQPAIMANPQPSNNNVNSTSNNENNGPSGNISGNSTSRPPEGEEHSVVILTTTTTNVTNNCKHNCNNINGNAKEHLAEVLVMPVNDTKAITATTTTATIAETATVAEATKSGTNTADESHEAGLNSWNCGNVENAATTATYEANIMAGVRSTSATAPIAQEEDDAEEIWYSGEEDGGRDAELAEKQRENCCCLVNDNERCCQVDIDLNINAIATTTTTTTNTEKPVQRSKSRVRTYLKRCRDRLTGQHQQAVANATNSTAATTTATKMYVQDEKCQESIGVEVTNAARSRSTQQFAALEEKKEEEAEAEGAYEEVENKACTTTLIATTEQQGDAATHTLLTPTALVVKGERTAGEEASLVPDEEAHLTSEQSVLAYDDIDFSLPSSSVLMDSGSSNVSADQQQQQQQQQQTTPLTSAKQKCDTLALAATEVEVEVDDSADLTVEQETRQMQQQCRQEQQTQSDSSQAGKLKCLTVAPNVARVKLLQQQQSLMSISSSCPPLVKEEQLACAIHMDSGTAALIDKHLAAIYPVYTACTRSILIRQARDLLVCSYLGCLQSFEMEFLCKFAEIAAELRQRHAVGVNVLWRKGWPLTTPTGEVILHLGALDDALIRPGDLYLCVKSVDKTETPQLHVVWRNASNGLQIQQQQAQQAHASATATFANCDTAAAATTTIQSHCIDFNATTTTTAVATTPPTHLSALTLEMLTSDELPQLLQHLLVGVEHSIERVSLNELQMPASTTAATATVPLASDEANNNGKCNGNNNSSSSGGVGVGVTNSSLMRCSNNNTITNSPKCALRRSELITKNKVLNNKFMLRRLTNRQDSMNSTSSGQSCGSSGSTSSDELLRCNGSHHNSYNNNNNTNNNNNNISSPCGNANTSDPLKMSAGATNSASTSPALPLFCLGNSFPHIDSDEENADEKRSAHGEDQFECEIVPPASISEIPEKLLTTSGIYLPGKFQSTQYPLQ
ncbi:uncharacterized protein LOC109579989 isoform X2 [Bactrocera dorsalis]|uniref:Uncharacterized protein LOC109579989 isoform X2 n=1 Tax=Bactrocera dorsalis TaxID=27457 RepID=A0ABM3JUP6_BACDO|nr:uncharacterized protein LOC109579989 isoform X2 [Bactrocera dorsalis]XP_049312953.1 uncharacterized protein LOC109579989 isoform X2 [Bactrocera dorsalis]XP_049312954.1 uncharacterized protein LOC109579989 isoform X2 [Bactrocera dorsalis]XP_049312955.1 uncharacterized protein LOC109579989 isoform X2 [Bactrocera dorsalis]XP_049312956.1 uncharacterized protein LOC109579989 isoform X2 [Bactrocera dorsalis]XP_049312957.1 uncharacterized protein LOC109579989 isoform X2 [Bactrocera dorsalis]